MSEGRGGGGGADGTGNINKLIIDRGDDEVAATSRTECDFGL